MNRIIIFIPSLLWVDNYPEGVLLLRLLSTSITSVVTSLSALWASFIADCSFMATSNVESMPIWEQGKLVYNSPLHSKQGSAL
ncbi:6978_t:CDS:2 [Funneliformis geosporum]|nr:6978_t:CDS:2 [Funneliformis geosporum]